MPVIPRDEHVRFALLMLVAFLIIWGWLACQSFLALTAGRLCG
jgi:hypothetical protein